MNHHYRDIIERIPEPPKWWDENAVPRWSHFAPDECANIYADEVVLTEIACQQCKRRFRVAFSWTEWQHLFGRPRESLSRLVRDGKIPHYGDPPNTGCCGGVTMNSEPLRVVEAWQKVDFEWCEVTT